MTYFVGGYYEKKIINEEELKVFDDIKIYNLEEALNLPFVEGVEDFYNNKFEEPEDRTNEFYELSDKELTKLIIDYVKDDESATLYAFDSLDKAKEFIDNYKASIENTDSNKNSNSNNERERERVRMRERER